VSRPEISPSPRQLSHLLQGPLQLSNEPPVLHIVRPTVQNHNRRLLPFQIVPPKLLFRPLGCYIPPQVLAEGEMDVHPPLGGGGAADEDARAEGPEAPQEPGLAVPQHLFYEAAAGFGGLLLLRRGCPSASTAQGRKSTQGVRAGISRREATAGIGGLFFPFFFLYFRFWQAFILKTNLTCSRSNEKNCPEVESPMITSSRKAHLLQENLGFWCNILPLFWHTCTPQGKLTCSRREEKNCPEVESPMINSVPLPPLHGRTKRLPPQTPHLGRLPAARRPLPDLPNVLQALCHRPILVTICSPQSLPRSSLPLGSLLSGYMRGSFFPEWARGVPGGWGPAASLPCG